MFQGFGPAAALFSLSLPSEVQALRQTASTAEITEAGKSE
jgi:hypothetical protein